VHKNSGKLFAVCGTKIPKDLVEINGKERTKWNIKATIPDGSNNANAIKTPAVSYFLVLYFMLV
jgi:hypothetical protein